MRILAKHRADFYRIGLEVRNKLLEQWRQDPARVGWGASLQGACAVASVLIFRQLRTLGFPAQLVLASDDCHCFVMVGKVVVDATASQFGFDCPDVVIGTHRELARRYGKLACWEIGVVTDQEEEINDAISTWDYSQQPQCCLESANS
jgi:hypothetical protein